MLESNPILMWEVWRVWSRYYVFVCVWSSCVCVCVWMCVWCVCVWMCVCVCVCVCVCGYVWWLQWYVTTNWETRDIFRQKRGKYTQNRYSSKKSIKFMKMMKTRVYICIYINKTLYFFEQDGRNISAEQKLSRKHNVLYFQLVNHKFRWTYRTS